MDNKQKRIIMFLFGCIITRLLLVYLAKNIDKKYLKLLGYISLLPAIGFIYIYLTDSRKTGAEVFGDKIWWNELRPIHGVLYLLFSIYAIKQKEYSYVPLLIDVILGLIAFLIHHKLI